MADKTPWLMLRILGVANEHTHYSCGPVHQLVGYLNCISISQNTIHILSAELSCRILIKFNAIHNARSRKLMTVYMSVLFPLYINIRKY